MIRQSLDRGSAHAMMIVSAGKGLAFQRRPRSRWAHVPHRRSSRHRAYWTGLNVPAPGIRAFQSADGKAWTLVGTDTIALESSGVRGARDDERRALACGQGRLQRCPCDAARRRPAATTAAVHGASGGLEQCRRRLGWRRRSRHVLRRFGNVRSARRRRRRLGLGRRPALCVYTAHGRRPYRRRVTSVQQVNAWTKAGVMIRATTAPGSMHGFMLVSGGNGSAFQRRPTTNGSSLHTSGVGTSPPWWVRLDRVGNTLKAYESADGETWSLVATQTTALPPTILVGLGVGSHVRGTVADAKFDRVSVSSLGSR